MTKDEARIIILEDALRQAQYTVEFLHNCLTNPAKDMNGGYNYAYPENTLRHLKQWAKLAPCREKPCFHSMEDDCPTCQVRHEQYVKLLEARKVLKTNGN